MSFAADTSENKKNKAWVQPFKKINNTYLFLRVINYCKIAILIKKIEKTYKLPTNNYFQFVLGEAVLFPTDIWPVLSLKP